MIAIMTQGGPYGSSNVLSYYMYETALSEYGFEMGYGSAIAVVLFIIMLIFITAFLLKMYQMKRTGDRCFRAPSNKPGHRRFYTGVMLPVSLFIWLLPLLAIFMTSIRSGQDINSGNVFGWPRASAGFQLFRRFHQSNAGSILNSIWITVPTVASL